MSSDKFKKHFTEVVPSKEPDWNRTYLPDYDVGDYLTHKEAQTPTQIIKITRVSNCSDSWYGSGIKYDSDLVLHFDVIKEAEVPEKLSPIQVRWFLQREHTELLYSQILKDYRPLTDTELLLYTTGEDEPKKKNFVFNW